MRGFVKLYNKNANSLLIRDKLFEFDNKNFKEKIKEIVCNNISKQFLLKNKDTILIEYNSKEISEEELETILRELDCDKDKTIIFYLYKHKRPKESKVRVKTFNDRIRVPVNSKKIVVHYIHSIIKFYAIIYKNSKTIINIERGEKDENLYMSDKNGILSKSAQLEYKKSGKIINLLQKNTEFDNMDLIIKGYFDITQTVKRNKGIKAEIIKDEATYFSFESLYYEENGEIKIKGIMEDSFYSNIEIQITDESELVLSLKEKEAFLYIPPLLIIKE